MRVKTLDGRDISWDLRGLEVRRDDRTKKSGPHSRAKDVIRSLFPMDRLLEEVPIPGTRMKADFYIPSRGLMVEVQGRQHFEHSAHLHGSYDNFLRSRRRDRRKAEFCDLNGITLIELREEETDDEWRVALDAA